MLNNETAKAISGTGKKWMSTGTNTAKSIIKKAGVGGVVGGAMFMSDVKTSMDEGSGLSSAVFKAGVQTALFTTHPLLMTAASLAPAIPGAYKAADTFRRGKAEQWQQLKRGGNGMVGNGFVDTNQAYTMRQAAVQQIQGNKLNARSALGGEARIFSNGYGK